MKSNYVQNSALMYKANKYKIYSKIKSTIRRIIQFCDFGLKEKKQ